MKKLIFILSFLSITACKSDDDNQNQDPVVEEWSYHKLFIDAAEEVLTSCKMQGVFHFLIME